MTNANSKTLIIGAGLSGLMAAGVLANAGQSITIVDGGRSVGGRLATRRIGPGRADHGAQFFTVRRPDFQRYVDEWVESGRVYQWSDGWRGGFLPDGREIREADGYPRYAVRDGFNALAKDLATDLRAKSVEIRTGVALKSVALEAGMPSSGSWLATDEEGRQFSAEAVVVTAPVPQSVALLDAGDVQLDAEDAAALQCISYAPCLCGLFWIDGQTTLPEPGAIPRPGGPVGWMADNRRKGISPEATLVTVHAVPEFSRNHYDADADDVLALLQPTLVEYLAPDAKIVEGQLKRWRYAQPEILHPERFLKAKNLPHLYFGGDAFREPRVEGAAMSGLRIGEDLIERG